MTVSPAGPCPGVKTSEFHEDRDEPPVRRTVSLIVVLAFLVRILAMVLVQHSPLGPGSEPWKSGLEEMFLMSIAGVGLAIVKKNYGGILLACAVMAYPVIYYLTDVYARYRHPIEPLMTVLGTFFAVKSFDSLRNRAIVEATVLAVDR